MIRSLLIGLVAGQRSMTPLAATTLAAVCGRLRLGHGLPVFLAKPLVAAGSLVLAVGELAGDKMGTHPIATAALAGDGHIGPPYC